MKDFFTQHLDIIFFALGLCVFAAAVVITMKKAKKIDKEGLTADAVVSKIIENNEVDGNDVTYTVYVQYLDRDGVKRESPVSVRSERTHEVGDEMRIKYIPGKYRMVRETK